MCKPFLPQLASLHSYLQSISMSARFNLLKFTHRNTALELWQSIAKTRLRMCRKQEQKTGHCEEALPGSSFSKYHDACSRNVSSPARTPSFLSACGSARRLRSRLVPIASPSQNELKYNHGLNCRITQTLNNQTLNRSLDYDLACIQPF